MIDLNIIDSINQDLLSKYRVLDGRPIYRLVFSDTQFEVRKGKFTDWYGPILIREVTEVRRIKKYWYIQPPCWILEKLVFIHNNQALKDLTEELVEGRNGTYEPVYTFRDAQDQPLEVNPRVVNFIIWKLHNPTKRLPSDWESIRLHEEQEETKYFEEEIGQKERSPLFVFENSAFVSTNQLKHKLEYVETHKKPLTGLE